MGVGEQCRCHQQASARLWNENQFSLRRRSLQQFVCAAGFCERQALGDDRVDLVRTEQLQQREEVLPEPVRVAGTSTDGKRSPTPRGNPLGALSPLLAPTG